MPSSERPTIEETDVLVAGGGTAGVVAALQAARAGVRTTLIEWTGQLGGTITNGGVAAPAHFFTRERQVIAGIGWELIVKTKAAVGSPMPDFRHPPPHRPQHHIGINPFVFALIAEEESLKAGVHIHYHETVASVTARPDGWEVETVGKNVRRRLFAREIVDATGDADVVRQAGFPVEFAEIRQPGTIRVRFGGYDPALLDGRIIESAYRRALETGALQPGDFAYADRPFLDFLKGHGCNAVHIPGADSSTAETQTEANRKGRAAVLRLLRFIRTLPGAENATLDFLAADTAVRETARIVGEVRITEADYLSGRLFPDAVAYTFYFIDLHTDHGVHHRFLPDGVVPTIPFGALVPKGARRLLVAGRSISSDRMAHSGLRVQASCMAMGQAAGAAAALGVQQNHPSRDIPVREIRALLARHEAILPPLPGED